MAENAGRPQNKAELREQIEAMLKKINPDYSILFAQPIEMRFNEMLEGTQGRALRQDLRQRLRRAGKARPNKSKASSKRRPASAQVEFETEGRTPQLQIQFKRDVLQRYGLAGGGSEQSHQLALAGREVGTIVDGNRNYDIVVRMPEHLRADDEEIKKLPVRVGRLA